MVYVLPPIKYQYQYQEIHSIKMNNFSQSEATSYPVILIVGSQSSVFFFVCVCLFAKRHAGFEMKSLYSPHPTTRRQQSC